MSVRTNLFEYRDYGRIEKSCLANDVTLTTNQYYVALIGDMERVHNVLTECFGEYDYTRDDDIILVNM
jgi:hypothetical protein